MFMTVMECTASATIHRTAQWPYSSIQPFLQPSPNSVGTGDHSDYPAGIVIWAVGDTISVLNATDLSVELASFQVNTKTTINDFYYKDDDGVETLYLALGTNGLYIFDFTNLASATLSTPDGIYAASNADPGYQIGATSQESEETTVIAATGVGYYDDQIFLTDNYFGLRVIDVSDLTSPFEILFDEPINILLQEWEWVDDPETGEPDYIQKTLERTSGYIQPNISNSYDVTGGYTNIEVIRFGGTTYACVLDYYYGLRVFDVTDPTEEIVAPVSKFMVTDNWYYYYALLNDIYVAVGSDYKDTPTDSLYAYVTGVDEIGSARVARLDLLADGGVLEYKDEDEVTSSIINIGRSETPGIGDGVFVSGDHAYVADGTNGLQIVDITTGDTVSDTSPVLNYQVAGSYGDNGNMAAISLAGRDGDKIYLHDTIGGLHQIDINVVANDDVDTALGAGGTTASPISGDSVFADGDFAYCIDSDKGFRIFDISEPSLPSLEAFYETTGVANDIFVLNNHAYLAKGDDGLEIVDVTTKTNPVVPAGAAPNGIMDTTGTAVAVAAYQSGGSTYACIADSGSGLAIIDVSTPATPVAPVYVAGGTANDVCISGDYAYIAEDVGLAIVDLSAAPVYTVVSTKAISDMIAVGVYTDDASNIYALISDSDGIMIENVTNPSSIPAETVATIATIEAGHPFISLEVVDNYLFASAGEKGVYVYDLSTPAVPVKSSDFEGIYSSNEVSPFKKDDNFYFVSAEESNVIAFYGLEFGSPDYKKFEDSSEGYCFITSLGF